MAAGPVMRVVIANRGEVAGRIIRACQELGYTSVLLHSTPDKNTPAFRMADETVELPGQTPLETYLNIPVVLQAAMKADAQMLHPGFGFLSENGTFAEEATNAGIIFVGPSAEAIRVAGNKIKAKELARKAKVPTVPSYTGTERDGKKLLAEAKKIGFPCIIKAAAGGGGKGMKVVREESEFNELLDSARREALNAFGSDVIFMEKYLEHPRHIEVQIMMDSKGNGVHFFERECSIQRRHQKILEETPSTALTPKLRDEITSCALRLAEEAGYVNAGTVEFLLDSKNNFFFMELNTRLQVEHTVTEMVCGVDLVHLQFAVALGEKIPLRQEQITQRGHALEARIYAENPSKNFLPSTGRLGQVILPLGPCRRFDFGYAATDEITPFYDPMIGKVITWAPSRAENLKRMHATLSELVIFGVFTNIEFLKAVLENAKFQNNQVSTSFLEEQFGEGFTAKPLSQGQHEFGREATQAARAIATGINGSHGTGLQYQSPWTNS